MGAELSLDPLFLDYKIDPDAQRPTAPGFSYDQSNPYGKEAHWNYLRREGKADATAGEAYLPPVRRLARRRCFCPLTEAL